MRLVMCDDNRLLCEALGSVLEAHGHQVLAIATSATDGIAAVAAHEPDACLLEIRMSRSTGLDAARAIRRSHPDVKIVVLSSLDDPAMLSEAKKAGVAGFLRKDLKTDTILAALGVIAAGRTAFGSEYSGFASWHTAAPPREDLLSTLTRRETQVLQGIVAGRSTAQMAAEMGVATSTLRSYIKNILAKLGAHSRLQAAAIASRELNGDLRVNGTQRMPSAPGHAGSRPVATPMDPGLAARAQARTMTPGRPPARNDDKGSASWESASSLPVKNAPSWKHSQPGSTPKATSPWSAHSE
jgi:two-component system, NarL family, nitrate/nitrite response regulator NarL